MKATKKPVTIECMKWDGTNFNEVQNFCGDVALFKENAETGCSELFIKTLEGDHHASAGDYIIRGVNGELYPCKPDIFEKTYDIAGADDKFNFGKAIELLKEGKKVCRAGWNGKGMFLTLQAGSIVKGTMMRNEPAKEFYGEGDVKICPHIDMKAADGSYVVGWLASQTDMLADDWMEA